jgi:signal transduction histidine kinase
VEFSLLVIGFTEYKALLNRYYLLIYGICYELLNNIVRHSGAKHALLQVTEHEEGFSLIAEDDGKGMKADLTTGPSLGLAGIRSRLKYFGGEMALDQNNPGGLIVTIEIPLKNEDA